MTYCTNHDQISLLLIGDIGDTFVQIAMANEQLTIDDRDIIKAKDRKSKKWQRFNAVVIADELQDDQGLKRSVFDLYLIHDIVSAPRLNKFSLPSLQEISG